MTLKEWLEKANISMCELARRLGRHPNTIRRLVNGTARPNMELAKEIQALTFNDVKAESLFGPLTFRPKCPTCGRVMQTNRSNT